MKALSIRQPWAHLIVNGYKDIENRDWPTRFRGPVLIHAGKRLTDDDYEDCRDTIQIIRQRGHQIETGNPKIAELRALCGGIVGIAEIVDCVSKSDSPWFFGTYGFSIKNARPLPFQPLKGQLGFFDVPHSLAALAME